MGTPPRSLQWVSSGDGMDTGPVLALEPPSTILPGNYRPAPSDLGQADIVLGDRSQEHTAPRRLFLGAHRS
jgi:hypothetical protein